MGMGAVSMASLAGAGRLACGVGVVGEVFRGVGGRATGCVGGVADVDGADGVNVVCGTGMVRSLRGVGLAGWVAGLGVTVVAGADAGAGMAARTWGACTCAQ